MKLNTRHFFIFLFFLSFKTMQAQEGKARVLIFLSPGETQIRLDDSLVNLTSKSFLHLNEGKHTVKLSALHRVTLDTSIYVKADSMSIHRFALRYKKDYVDYRRALYNYKLQKFTATLLPPIVIAAALITTFSFKQTSNDFYHKAENNIDQYNNAITNNQTDYDNYQKEFDQNYKKYKLFDKLSYVTLAAACGATYYYIKLLRHERARHVPVYEEKLSFDLLPGVDPYSTNGQLSFQLKYKL